jgi:hypothetical protein
VAGLAPRGLSSPCLSLSLSCFQCQIPDRPFSQSIPSKTGWVESSTRLFLSLSLSCSKLVNVSWQQPGSLAALESSSGKPSACAASDSWPRPSPVSSPTTAAPTASPAPSLSSHSLGGKKVSERERERRGGRRRRKKLSLLKLKVRFFLPRVCAPRRWEAQIS